MTRSEWGGLAVFGLVAAALAVRLPVGLDLSDEAYYAIFIDDWLKGGIASSTLMTLHQSAALLVYPFAKLFVAAAGSSDGLLLFLRGLFLIGAVLAAALWTLFLRRCGFGARAWLAGAVVLAFVPFGLPAPSYNTLGMQALTAALAAYGIATLRPRRAATWLVASAVAWAIVCIAYPSLILAFAAFIILAWRRDRLPFLAGATLAVLGGWAVAVAILSPGRVLDSIVYLSQINDAGGLAKKIAFSAGLLADHPGFALLAALALALGIGRRRLDPRIASAATALLLAMPLLLPPTLYVRSHDAVVLAALTGIGLLHGLWRPRDAHAKLLAQVYAASLAAGLVITASATNAIYNSCIGVIPAASLALATLPPPAGRWRALAPLAALAALASILSTTLLVPYGEQPGDQRRTIRGGFLAGIRARPDDVALLDMARAAAMPLLAPEATLAVIGRSPGLALALPARLKMPTAFPLQPGVPAAGLAATLRFYEDPAHRPAVVLIYEDPYFRPLNPMEPRFNDWYRRVEILATPLGRLEVFTRR